MIPGHVSPNRVNARLISFASQIDASNLTSRQVDSAPDYLARANYEPLAGVGNGLGAQPRLISKETKASL